MIAAEFVDCSSARSGDTIALNELNSHCDTEVLGAHLNYNLASLFLKMQSVLHILNMASQEIEDHFKSTISLETLLNEVFSTTINDNDIVTTKSQGEQLSSEKERHH